MFYCERLAWPLHKDDTLFQSGRPTGLNIYFAFLFLHPTQPVPIMLHANIAHKMVVDNISSPPCFHYTNYVRDVRNLFPLSLLLLHCTSSFFSSSITLLLYYPGIAARHSQ